MSLVALLAHGEDTAAGAESSPPARARALVARRFLAALESPRAIASAAPGAAGTAATVAPAHPVEVVADLDVSAPGELPADVAARARRALLAAFSGDGVAVLDAAVISVLIADVLGARGEEAPGLRPAAGAVTLLRRTDDELTLAMFGVQPSDPLRREDRGPAVERRLYLLRHAECETVTPDGRVFSHAPLPLTARGREQAAALAAAFAGVPVEVVHASDIARAAETARALAGPDRGLRLHHGLREIPLGALEGAHAGEVFGASTGFLEHPDAALPGGESFRQVGDRAAAALGAILDAEDGDAIVLAHGGVNRTLLGRLLGLPPERALRIRQDWACVNVLDREDGRWRPRTVNWSPAGLEELEQAQRAALVRQGPTAPGGHVMDWRTA